VIVINGTMFLTEMMAGEVARLQALKADALDFFAATVTYGLSLAVNGANLRMRAATALLKGGASWRSGSLVTTIYQTLVLGIPKAKLMKRISVSRASG